MKQFYTFLFLLSFGVTFGQVNYLRENFDYTTGTDLTANGWAAHSSAATLPVKVSNGGLSWTGYIGSGVGNAALVAPTANAAEDVNRKLTADIREGVVYASFLVNKSTTSSGVAAFFFHLGFYTNPNDLTTVSTNFRGRTWVLAPSDPLQTTKYRIGLTFNSNTAADAIATATTDLDKGTTYLVVVKYQFVPGALNDTTSLYVFPEGADISKEPATPTIGPLTGTAVDADVLQNVVLRQANSNQGTTVDGILVRTEWNLTSAGQDIDNVWTGASSTDWATAGNWTNGVPTGSSNVLIPAVTTNYPTATSAVSVNTATIGANARLNAESTFSGTVKYERFLSSGNWHLVSSPVSGQSYNNAFVSTNALAISGNNNGISTYNTSTNTWSYMQTGGSGSFTNAKGYSVKRVNPGMISFSGTLNTDDVTVPVVVGGNGFNLLGNPYSTTLKSDLFLTGNTANLVSETIWLWNQGTSNYEVKVTADQFPLAPGQGFFVRANTATNLSILESYKATTTSTFQKTARTEVVLNMTDGANNRFAKMYYLANATKGFDNGYDGETFSGVENSVDVFTNLVENNEGKKYQVQSLPISEMESMIVPVGVKAAAGKEITFTAEALNLPNDVKVFLEDRVANTITRLDEANATYKVTLSETLDGIGRFYVHTKTSGVLSTDDVLLESISIYAPNKTTLKIAGITQGKATVKLFNILGKELMATSFTSSGVQEIALPKLATGMYLVQLETAAGKLNKKIVLE